MKIVGIKKAVGDYKEWLNSDWRHRASIMFDREKGKVWCDQFVSCNNWIVYESDDIVNLTAEIKDDVIRDGKERTINMKTIREYAERCKK